MSKFWKTIITVLVIVIIFAGLMILITYIDPSIKSYAMDIAKENDLPLWIVGLFAPIAYALKKLKNAFSNLLGDTQTESEIRKENEAIKAELIKLRTDVNTVDEWRRRSIHREITEIGELQKKIGTMESRSAALGGKIATLSETPAMDLLKDMSDEEIENEIERRNAALGISRGKLRRID